MGKKFNAILNILILLISAILVAQTAKTFLNASDTLKPDPILLNFSIVTLGFAILFTNMFIVKSKMGKLTIIANTIFLLAISVTGYILQTILPFITLASITNIIIFHKRPYLMLIFAIPSTILYIVLSAILLSDNSLNNIVLIMSAIIPLIVSDCIIATMLLKRKA